MLGLLTVHLAYILEYKRDETWSSVRGQLTSISIFRDAATYSSLYVRAMLSIGERGG